MSTSHGSDQESSGSSRYGGGRVGGEGHEPSASREGDYGVEAPPDDHTPPDGSYEPETPPVPTTSIFTRTDGVVAWQCCLQKPGARAESIEVLASHCGIGMNAAAWYAIADRLSQGEGKWKPFHREGWRQWLYRDPYRAQDRG